MRQQGKQICCVLGTVLSERLKAYKELEHTGKGKRRLRVMFSLRAELLERISYICFLQFLSSSSLLNPLLSVFHSYHSTETALVKVPNGLHVLNSICSQFSAFILTDLSTAFDTADYSIITSILHLACINHLPWLPSCLTGHSFSVFFLVSPTLEGWNALRLSYWTPFLSIAKKVDTDNISSVQSLSRVWLFATPRSAACQASLSITNFRSLLKLMSIESVMPSSHLIFCCPLLLLPPTHPSIRVFSSESTLRMRWPKVLGVSASSSVLPMNSQEHPSPLGWTAWISLQSKGFSRVFSNTTVQKHQFFGAQLSSQSNSHIHTWPLEKP